LSFKICLELTPDRLIRLLNNPELLATISFEELKSLTIEYPYAGNLHLLLALKAQQLNNPDLEQLLQMATLHALDRKHFFAITHRIPASYAPVAEADVHDGTPAAAQGTDAVVSLPFSEWYARFNLMPAKPRRQPAMAAIPAEKSEMPTVLVEEVGNAEAYGLGSEQTNTPAPAPEQIPEEPAHPVQGGDPVPPKPVAQELAAESVRLKSSVKSVTLAHLLAMQGNLKAAVAMLEQLMLDNPEKSAYFAAEIEKIKQH
jgi:hypothetical protein